MDADEELLRRAYAAFNARDIDGALALMRDDVDWPDEIEHARLHTHDDIRAYWEGQFARMDPHVEPVEFRRVNDRVEILVHQVVRDLDGVVRADTHVRHVYVLKDGLVARMDVVYL